MDILHVIALKISRRMKITIEHHQKDLTIKKCNAIIAKDMVTFKIIFIFF